MPVPPAPVTGIKLVAAWLCVNAVEATAAVAVTAEFTIRTNILLADTPFVSVTITVNVVAVSVAVGVPLMAPVEVLKLNPAGSVPAVIA